MAGKYTMSYMDAVEKVLNIVKRDKEHVKPEESEFSMRVQIDCLLEAYDEVDADTAFQKINKIEKNKSVLSEDIAFILKISAVKQHQPNRRFNFSDGIRFEHLMSKYQLPCAQRNNMLAWKIQPIRIAFPDEEYNLKKENPSLCRGLPDEMKKYKNFKREYDVEGMMALLPSGKKFGGFIKAFLHAKLLLACNEIPAMMMCLPYVFHRILAELRRDYNSSIFSEEKRVEWFDKMAIKEEDCALWSRLFDQQYPGYKDVYKFFGQLA